ncbi:MAG: cytoplasmic protein [Deltaproteobacteria bacterium]|nr:cytoplasmic protein [Deltaproteobacteria bacterium]
MEKRSHRFVETHDGFIGFGMDRKSDEEALVYYLQAFSDDALMEAIVPRMTDMEINDLFSRISGLLRKHLSEPEYHRLFLKE